MTSNLQEKLQEKAYRDAFVASQIRIALPFQIRALREQRGWTQAQLAEKAGMLQPRISAMERPGGSKFNLETVLRVAAALDVAFIGRFASFSELAAWADNFSPDTFLVPSFDNDLGLQDGSVASAVQTSNTDSKMPPGELIFAFGIGTQSQKNLEENHPLKIPTIGGQFKIRFPQEGIASKPYEPSSHQLLIVVDKGEIPSDPSPMTSIDTGEKTDDERPAA